MSEEMLIRHCAPTLAAIKTGNLFSCTLKSKADFIVEIRKLNRALVPKGVRVIPLRYWPDRVLIYVFRPAELRRDLKNAEAVKLLKAVGYRCDNPEQCLTEMIRRLEQRKAFPHEIGLFLGYPPEDVRGFIENKAENFKCVGCWKVYGDEQCARARFARFEKCTRCYSKQWAAGVGIERLIVAG